ncbi:MAG: CvpA family protein [Anaerolineae bacterium]|jgi:hypothetical protein
MTLLEKAQKPPIRSKGIVALIVETLGVIGIVVFYFYGPRELRGMDLAMLFVVVSFAAYGSMQNIIRGLMTAVSVYLATGIAATAYPALTPYARTFLILLTRIGLARPPIGNVDFSALALSFVVLTVILWLILELLFRASFPDTRVAFLGFVDRAVGAMVYLVIGVAVATLLFNAIGYGVAGRRGHDLAALRPEFNQVLERYYQGQSFWFRGRPPAIYAYDLVLP